MYNSHLMSVLGKITASEYVIQRARCEFAQANTTSIDLCSSEDEDPLHPQLKASGGGGGGSKSAEIDLISDDDATRIKKTKKADAESIVAELIDLCSDDNESPQKNVKIPNKEINISNGNKQVDLSSNGDKNNHEAAQTKFKFLEGSTANRAGALWAETATNLFSWQTDSQQAVSTAVFNRLSVNFQTLLLHVVQGKYTDAIKDGITKGILAESGHGDKRTQGGQIIYVQVGRSKNTSLKCAPAACICRYIEAYPADLGESAEDTKDLVHQILVNAGLDPEITVPLLQIVHNIQPSTQIDGPHLYFGILDIYTAHKHLQQDLDRKGTRFCNFTHANKKFVSFKAYSMSEFEVPLSTGLRTDRNAGQVEVAVIQTLSGLGLDHAVDGYIPYFTTNSAFTMLTSGLLPSTTPLFGTMPCPVSTSFITAHLEDQKRYLINHVVGDSISQTSFVRILHNGPGVFQTNGHYIPSLWLMEIISLEDHSLKRGQEKIGGIWDVNAGHALKTFHHLVAAIYPEILCWLFWSHCMWMSCTLVKTGVIVITTWSEAVDSAMSGGYLTLVWTGIPSDPDADKAYIAFNIILCTELIYQTALAKVEILRQEGMVPARTLEDETWRYFETLKARVEGKIGASGLQEKLEQANTEYNTRSWIHDHLRCREATTKPRKPRRPDFTIPGVTHTVGRPGTPKHITQFDTLKAQWRKRTRSGVNSDPFHLIPYEYKDDPFDADMREARPPDFKLKLHARAMESHTALSHNKEALSLVGHMTTALPLERKCVREDVRQMVLTCIKQLGEWRKCTGGVQPNTGSCLAKAWRWGTCSLCSKILVANSENLKHACAEDEEENLELRQRELLGLDLAEVAGLNVYIKKEDLNNNWWQATLAVNICLPLVSTCPKELWPTTALDRDKA
ncbi:hypothetical protein B0H19DRAFT_1057979 [Mycena capillaripes]|nr:hypothetical protein B0H19DRAFT_1057979 [Mycena capillaripes]